MFQNPTFTKRKGQEGLREVSTLLTVLRTSVAMYHCNSLLVFLISLNLHAYISSTS